MQYLYSLEKFDQARRNLMLPHPKGEAESIVMAFQECMHGLHDVDRSELDDYARGLVETLEKFMNTKNVPGESGRWLAKAEGFSVDEKLQIAELIDGLAHWFGRARD